MKLIQSTFFGVLFCVTGVAAADDWQFQFSSIVLAGQQPWRGIDTTAMILPDLRADYGRWSLGGAGVLLQYRLLDDMDALQITPGIGYRDEGYGQSMALQKRQSHAPVFVGYRPPQEELVARLDIDYQWLNLQVAQDISDRSGGSSLLFTATYPLYQHADNAEVYLSAGVNWRSADYANALYGIQGHNIDAGTGRRPYNIGSTSNPLLSLDYFYLLTPQWQLHAGLSYERLDSAIRQSPLVDKGGLAVAMLTITYR